MVVGVHRGAGQDLRAYGVHWRGVNDVREWFDVLHRGVTAVELQQSVSLVCCRLGQWYELDGSGDPGLVWDARIYEHAGTVL